jgi:hypothetical protein
MMMIKQYFSLIFLLLFGILLQAQSSRLKVYIGLVDGKKLEGFVETRKWKPWSRTIPFNNLLNDEKRTLGIDSIDFVHVGEEGNKAVFIAYRGVVNEIAHSAAQKAGEAFWLQELVSGEVNLYVKAGPDEVQDYFMSKKNQGDGLTVLRYSGLKPGEKRAAYRQYRNYLKGLLEDCEGTATRINRFGVEPSKLEQLIIAYNTCESDYVDYIAIPPASSLQLDAIAGGAFTRVSRTEDQLIGLSSAALMPRIGGALTLYTPRSLYTRAWVAEVLYSPYQTTDQQGEIDVRIDYLQLNMLYKNSWAGRSSWPYLLAGLKYQARLNEQQLDGLPEQVMIQHMPGLVLGFGLDIGPVGLGIRYEMDNLGLIFPQSPDYYANSLSLLINYKLYH